MSSVRNGAWHDELFSTYGSSIFRMLRNRVHDHGTAEDLTQETFTTAWKLRYKVPDDALPWLYATAINHWREYMRKTRRQADLPGDDSIQAASDTQPGPAPPIDEIMDIRMAIASLDADEREVLWFADVQDERSDDVGERLGITAAAARQRKKRASDQVRQMLGATYLQQDYGDNEGARR